MSQSTDIAYRPGDRVIDTRTGDTGSVVHPENASPVVWWDGQPEEDTEAVTDAVSHMRPLRRDDHHSVAWYQECECTPPVDGDEYDQWRAAHERIGPPGLQVWGEPVQDRCGACTPSEADDCAVASVPWPCPAMAGDCDCEHYGPYRCPCCGGCVDCCYCADNAD